MICQKCRAEVADDLIFCTECGERLFETQNSNPTVFMNDSVITKVTGGDKPRKSSNLKLIVLVIALIVIPAGLFAGYFLMFGNKSNQTTADIKNSGNKTPTPKNNKTKNNSNAWTNISKANQNVSNQDLDNDSNSPEIGNENPDSENNDNQIDVWNEHIEIAPGEHYAVPFKAEEKQKISGKVELLSGKSIEGYVYLQSEYDEHFPDTNYKVFSFEGEKTADIEQTLIKESYVLVFVNNSEVSTTLKGRIYLSK